MMVAPQLEGLLEEPMVVQPICEIVLLLTALLRVENQQVQMTRMKELAVLLALTKKVLMDIMS